MTQFPDADLIYCIFNRDDHYEVSCLNFYESPDEYQGVFTGWDYKEEDKANKVAYILNHISDPLAIKWFMEIATCRL